MDTTFKQGVIDSLSCKKAFESIVKITCLMLKNSNVDVNLGLNFEAISLPFFLFTFEPIYNFLDICFLFRFKYC